MGVSSSRPEMPDGRPSTALSARDSPDYSPSMDDIAASQQLLSESGMYHGDEQYHADAPDTTVQNTKAPALNLDGAAKQLAASRKRKGDTLGTGQRRRKSKRQEATTTRKLQSSRLATAQTRLNRRPGQPNSDHAPVAGPEDRDTAVEVPDSQYAPVVEATPLSPPPMSSMAVPASMPEPHDSSEAAGSASVSRSQHSPPQDEDALPEEVDEGAVLDEEVVEIGHTQNTTDPETEVVFGQSPATCRLKPQRSTLGASKSPSSLKRPRKLRKSRSSHFMGSDEEAAEEPVDSDQNLNKNPSPNIAQVPGEELRSAKKARRRRSKEKASSIPETLTDSLQTPPESLNSAPQELRTESASLLTLPEQSTLGPWLSNGLRKEHRGSKNHEQLLSSSREIDSEPDPPVLNEHDLEGAPDVPQSEGEAAEQSDLENGLDNHEHVQPGDAEDGNPEERLRDLDSPQCEGGAVEDSELEDADQTDLFIPDTDAPGESRDHEVSQTINHPEMEELPQTASDESNETATTKQQSRKAASHKRGVPRNQLQEPESYDDDTAEALDTITAAEEVLQNVRDLPINADKRTSGDFTADEEEIIRRAVRDYQQSKGWETSDLVRIIQWRSQNLDRAKFGGESESRRFWDVMRQYLVDSGPLTRRMPPVKKYIRSQYHDFKRSAWTKEEDEKLLEYYEIYSGKWKVIGPLLNRSKDDVRKHWEEHVQYRDQRQGRWSLEEEAQLVLAVNTVAQKEEDRRYQEGWLPQAHNAEHINWPQVVSEMGNVRGRVQASVKWKQMMARENPPKVEVNIKPRGPDAKPEPRRAPDSGASKAGIPESRFINKTTSSHDPETPGVTPRKKRGRPRKQDAQSTTTPRSPSPGTTNDKAGIATMLWGDKFDLVEHLMQYSRHQQEEDIDWEAAAAKLGQRFSIRVLQAALRELCTIVKDDITEPDTLHEELMVAVMYLCEQHGPELGQHYDPFSVEIAPATGISDESTTAPPTATKSKKQKKKKIVAPDSSSGVQPASQSLDTEAGHDEASAVPKPSKKRKVATGDAPAKPQRALSRKKQKTTAPGIPKQPKARKPKAPTTATPKSKMFITESDEATSEPEL